MTRRLLFGFLTALLGLFASTGQAAAQTPPPLIDSIYVGDDANSAVNRYYAFTGAFQNLAVPPSSGGLLGPRGILRTPAGELLVASQNTDLDVPGEVLRYNAKTGKFIGKLIKSTDPRAPFAPRGMVLQNNVLYVADFVPDNSANPGPGRIATYNATTGAWLGDLDARGYPGTLRPRGLVINFVDKLLYVSNSNIPANPNGGAVLRFNVQTRKFVDVFITSNAQNGLNRPEGLVFDLGQQLYVTSFRGFVLQNGALVPDLNDTDRILVFAQAYAAKPGALVKKIDLAPPVAKGGKRAFAQACLFGAYNGLYVPISGGDPTTAGQLRRYNISTGKFDLIGTTAPPGALWYLTFDNTNPATLNYGF